MSPTAPGRPLFTVEERERAHDRLVEMAREDPRVTAAAVVGSRGAGRGDRWSDLDLTFGLAPDASIPEVLADWSRSIEAEFGAVHLFDVPFRSSLYRVFLFPGNLQVDISFTPGAEFGAFGPNFTLLFGAAVERPHTTPPTAEYMLGFAAHHAVRARFCIERGRLWQAEYLISGIRHEALGLACLERGLEPREARGYDQLPAELKIRIEDALVRSVERAELLRALGAGIEALLGGSSSAPELRAKLQGPLRELTAPDWGRAD